MFKLFKKTQKNNDCCNVKIEEVKEEKKTCCNVKIEEVTETVENKTTKANASSSCFSSKTE